MLLCVADFRFYISRRGSFAVVFTRAGGSVEVHRVNKETLLVAHTVAKEPMVWEELEDRLKQNFNVPETVAPKLITSALAAGIVAHQ